MSKEEARCELENPRFHRRKEDFSCLHCGVSVTGDGFTNHCPVCLWSRHVDISPGDRAATCGGLMEPERAEYRSGRFTIVHRCVECGFVRRNRQAPEDDRETLIQLTAAR